MHIRGTGLEFGDIFVSTGQKPSHRIVGEGIDDIFRLTQSISNYVSDCGLTQCAGRCSKRSRDLKRGRRSEALPDAPQAVYKSVGASCIKDATKSN